MNERSKVPASGESGSSDPCGVSPCGEPMMALAPDETIYFSAPRGLVVCCNTQASPRLTSTDGGATWQGPISPTSSGGAWSALTGLDTQIVVDKRGTVYVGEL